MLFIDFLLSDLLPCLFLQSPNLFPLLFSHHLSPLRHALELHAGQLQGKNVRGGILTMG